MKFLELSEKAQKKACLDYVLGWDETHEKIEDRITLEDARIILVDNNSEDEYLEDGTYINEYK